MPLVLLCVRARLAQLADVAHTGGWLHHRIGATDAARQPVVPKLVPAELSTLYNGGVRVVHHPIE